MRFWLAIAAILILCGCASVISAPSPEPRKTVHSKFLRTPTTSELNQYYPAGAKAASIAGTAKVTCNVSEAGDLVDCKVLSESPVGYGFGEAGLSMTKLFKLSPELRDGKPVAGDKFTSSFDWHME